MVDVVGGDNGNAEQVRRIARQLIDEWKEEERKQVRRASIPAWVACALSILAVFWQAAIQTKTVAENTRRIEVIEGAKLSEGLATVNAKLDILVAQKGTN